ncbi:hypothetical protein GEMRC1_011369 [Eukaryota sp. GEM-RC1]
MVVSTLILHPFQFKCVILLITEIRSANTLFHIYLIILYHSDNIYQSSVFRKKSHFLEMSWFLLVAERLVLEKSSLCHVHILEITCFNDIMLKNQNLGIDTNFIDSAFETQLPTKGILPPDV